ncbi:hypothetical protein [Caulobacter sp. D5]|nr:hypothetical protein [Caulobacter sp. D5]
MTLASIRLPLSRAGSPAETLLQNVASDAVSLVFIKLAPQARYQP